MALGGGPAILHGLQERYMADTSSFEEDLQRFSTHISRRRVVAKRGPRWPLRTRPIVSPQGDAMDEEIPKSVLDAMRELSDVDLAKLIKVISDYDWAKAATTLRLMMEEKEKADDKQ